MILCLYFRYMVHKWDIDRLHIKIFLSTNQKGEGGEGRGGRGGESGVACLQAQKKYHYFCLGHTTTPTPLLIVSNIIFFGPWPVKKKEQKTQKQCPKSSTDSNNVSVLVPE